MDSLTPDAQYVASFIRRCVETNPGVDAETIFLRHELDEVLENYDCEKFFIEQMEYLVQKAIISKTPFESKRIQTKGMGYLLFPIAIKYLWITHKDKTLLKTFST